MPVEIDGTEIASWTPVITRGGPFIFQIGFLDSNGDPVATLDAQFIVEPDNAAEVTWDSNDGRFTNVGVGLYLLSLSESYTDSLVWSSGHYHILIVDASGFTQPCIIGGLIFARDC